MRKWRNTFSVLKNQLEKVECAPWHLSPGSQTNRPQTVSQAMRSGPQDSGPTSPYTQQRKGPHLQLLWGAAKLKIRLRNRCRGLGCRWEVRNGCNLLRLFRRTTEFLLTAVTAIASGRAALHCFSSRFESLKPVF